MSKGKDPAFLFYPGYWRGGTNRLTRHQKGCYMDLLLSQFDGGPLSIEDIKTVLGADFGPHWPTLQKKFKTTEDGHFYNERLAIVISERADFSKKQSEKAAKRWGKDAAAYPAGYAQQMHNTNEDEIIVQGKGVKGENPPHEINLPMDDFLKQVVLPFRSAAFASAWMLWLKFRRDAKKPYHTLSNIQKVADMLGKYPEAVAIKMIDTALEKNWVNIRELESDGNNKPQSGMVY